MIPDIAHLTTLTDGTGRLEHYATTQASYVIVRMAQSFSKVEPADSREWEEHLGLTLSNRNGVNLRFFE